ncbi:MAG: N-acetylmuramoyl-L-alanine amidase [Phycisphaerae bacterium]
MHFGGPQLTGAPSDSISIYQLAGRLKLSVAKASSHSAVLRNSDNSLMVYGEPNGQVVLNGQQLGRSGCVENVGGILFVPKFYESGIRRRLKKASAIPPLDYTRRSHIAPEPEPQLPSYLGTVVIDAGHGGKDPGALGVTGLREKDVNLAVATKLARLLKDEYVKVIMTREDDRFIELNDRASFCNKRRPDLFVSIHSDSAPRSGATGSSVYISREPSKADISGAEALVSMMKQGGIESRGIKNSNFRVLVRTACPAVLVECGYLSNPGEARNLATDSYQQKLARSICNGIVSFLEAK